MSGALNVTPATPAHDESELQYAGVGPLEKLYISLAGPYAGPRVHSEIIDVTTKHVSTDSEILFTLEPWARPGVINALAYVNCAVVRSLELQFIPGPAMVGGVVDLRHAWAPSSYVVDSLDALAALPTIKAQTVGSTVALSGPIIFDCPFGPVITRLLKPAPFLGGRPKFYLHVSKSAWGTPVKESTIVARFLWKIQYDCYGVLLL